MFLIIAPLSPPGSTEALRVLFIVSKQQHTHTLLFTTRSRGNGLVCVGEAGLMRKRMILLKTEFRCPGSMQFRYERKGSVS